jgi:CheY-like chemotaxis protein
METHRILIVEDERVVALDMRRTLRHWGYTDLAVATSGQEAIDKAAKFRPDLVLMDIALEGRIDGIEAASRIQRDLGLPVIFLTAHGDDETTHRALEACKTGVLRFIIKPIDEEILKTAIHVALSREAS